MHHKSQAGGRAACCVSSITTGVSRGEPVCCRVACRGSLVPTHADDKAVGMDGAPGLLTLDSVVPLKTFSDGADTCSHSERSFLELTHSGSLIDDYFKGELAVHVYLRARNEVSDSKSRDLCIVFENMLSDSKIEGLDAHSIFGQIELDGTSSKNCACQIEPSVTVNFGPSIENEERLSNVPCHSQRLASCSRIRLYSFEDSPHIIREILHTPNTLN